MLKKLIDYLVNDLGVQPNTAATIILTLFTFSLGFIITWTAAAISKWLKRKKYRKSFKIILNDFISACKIQYQELEKFPLQKGYLNGGDYTITVKTNYGLKYLANLDINVFIDNFSSLFKKNRAAEVSQLLEIVEQVKSDRESIKELIDFTYLKYSESFDIYNENLDSLRKLYENLPLKYNGTAIEANFHIYIQSIIDTFNRWNEKGALTHINVTLDQIVNPLYTEAKKISQNEISRDVIEHTLKCR